MLILKYFYSIDALLSVIVIKYFGAMIILIHNNNDVFMKEKNESFLLVLHW